MNLISVLKKINIFHIFIYKNISRFMKYNEEMFYSDEFF